MTDSTDFSLKILIVEDNQPTLMVMKKLITHLGHSVDTAETVAGAVAKLGADKFDLMLSDLGLPDGSGIEILQKTDPATRPKAIALTGYGDDDDLRTTREAGFTLHLTKPINFDQLKDAIGKAMQA